MAFRGVKLISQQLNFNFMRFYRVFLVLSVITVMASIGLYLTRGLNQGIDFTGGLLIEIGTPEKVDLADLRKLFAREVEGDVSLQYFGDDRTILVRLPVKEGDRQAEMVDRAKTLISGQIDGVEFRKTEFVGPMVGEELLKNSVIAMLCAFGAIFVYIWFRFEWQYSLGGIIALLHDAALMFLFYTVTQVEFNLSSVAAVLTVVGYSINDSVVIYDRVRENLRRYKKMPLIEVINVSVNETLSRTILTAGTTVLALVALTIFGGEIIRNFCIGILFGIVVGTYSSIYVSAPVLMLFGLKRTEELEGSEVTP
jgi:preprotein translocase SecF subunit